ncbi:hypothetical protein BpHYR1_032132 [Brachionus plicatilis]|uniref:Uncharacterized protein n=1 Tax=Brachionus plicatilis TaxID=10195 RepID=A0A3M7QN88_BRAPC|nr:hypothetical protein BpHYR1_032132 [Brachionus plicatilis]
MLKISCSELKEIEVFKLNYIVMKEKKIKEFKVPNIVLTEIEKTILIFLNKNLGNLEGFKYHQKWIIREKLEASYADQSPGFKILNSEEEIYA